MGDLDPRVERTLDELVPRRPAPDSWDAIAGAAAAPRRRWLLRAAPVAGVTAAAVLLALAWPLGGGPRGTILERAAAAVGDGPVLHVVIRSGWGGTLVDLDTGAREAIHSELEIWYDPDRGIHEISRFGGAPQSDAFYPPGRLSYLDNTLGGLATSYRDALRDGTARVLEAGVVEGEPVHWIRADTQMHLDVGDGRLHEWAHDVAVSQDSFEPVATRETRDRELSPDGISIVLSVETLSEGAGDFTPRSPKLGPVMSSQSFDLPTPSEATEALGRPALWAGPRVAGLDLAHISKEVRREGYDPATGTWEKTYMGVIFFYGGRDEHGIPREDRSHLRISQSPTRDRGFQPLNYSPPEGSVLVFSGGRDASMVKDGLHIDLGGVSEELILAAARALEPVPAS